MVFSSLGVFGGGGALALLLLVTATLLRVTATLLAPVAASFHRYGILAVSPAVSRFGTTAGVLEESATELHVIRFPAQKTINAEHLLEFPNRL
ncbi:hypothetical protein LH427_09740 [Laribacter hongkongensis]|uniref:hypothetical protein n=1 Tax=Laribacter hongkongensis TaxID=168471 RepID=UPI001EFED929|nr:hypothetical protein [Laribacter hongkongensis]MCG8993254.1 hypothetical protein [Laribacter hongkongensis]MCG8997927.1 hypothetical protein [Laribacter hongkongensis]MCG9002362.1 hypothetical protein [Laribacter hongkongensis]MCG9005672.1 hypothetical protein [Laribacter hongkongensis]MCG9008809.1 hypothetical protein [Laribacter hongkongensis]